VQRNDTLLWGGAIGLSLALHGALLLHSGSHAGAPTPPQVEMASIRFQSVAAPMPERPAEAQVTEAPSQERVETVPQKEPAQGPEQAPPRPEPEPVKAAPKAPPPRAPVAPPAKPEPKPEPRKAKPAPAAPPPATPPASAAAASRGSVADPALIERAKAAYLHRLAALIEQHKHYPKAARRRRIEGAVQVSFSLHAEGRVSAIHITQGHRLLHEAAQAALEAAQPLPPPPAGVTLPLPIQFEMQFQLNDT